MNNIVSVKLDSRYASTLGVWQYDYGQVLRITGPELPPAVEVQFSLTEKSGETLSRVGTTVDGVTEVKIPDELLTHSATSNYRIYAYIYLTDETSGSTKYEITIPVRVRSKPTSPAEDPETDPDLFRETVVAINASAERAKMAEQNAKASATEAGKYAASASESAVTAEKTKEDALRKVGEKKREAIEAIQNQEETSVGKITTHTDGEIQRIQNQATDSKAGLEQTITNADASKKELEHSIETAGTSKTALDKSVELAGTVKTELDTSIREAGTAKIALDESTETAGTVQETLSATVNQAGALDTSLGEEIETGTQLKTDLVASGEKAVQDIQAVGSEQLGKMQAVAEEFTADREQIANNKEDIGSLKEDLGNKITKFYASNQGETHITDSDNGKIQDMIIYGRSSRFTTTGKNLANGQNAKCYINSSASICGVSDNDTGMAIDASKLTNVTISTRSIQDRYRVGCTNTFPTKEGLITCYNGRKKDGTKDSYTIDTTDYNYLIVNATKLEDIQVEKGSEATSYEPYTGGIPSPSPDYPQEIKSVVNPTVKVTNEDGLKVQSVTLNNITLNAIPVASGGNVTIDGQQYIADRVVEKDGVFGIERNTATDVPVLTKELRETPDTKGRFIQDGALKKTFTPLYESLVNIGYSRKWGVAGSVIDKWIFGVNKVNLYISPPKDLNYTSEDTFNALKDLNIKVYGALLVPFFEPLPGDIQAKLRTLVTNYPVTNISVTSDQLDGYAVFNYPISMANGWNYVKQQLNDNRDYIYDMDIQSAEAYVNSEYAVALTELEV